MRQSEAHGADLLRTRRAKETGAGQPLGQKFSSKSEENWMNMFHENGDLITINGDFMVV